MTSKLQFNEKGLILAIAQDVDTGEVRLKLRRGSKAIAKLL